MAMALSFSAPASAQDNSKTAANAEESTEDEDGAQVDGEVEGKEEGDESSSPSLRRGNRMEFDARLIRGESAGSGAVFLFQRAQRPLPSMIQKRSSFLRDTVDALLGDSWAEKFDDAQSQNAQTD